MFCPKCGLQNADDTKFCRNCGGNLSNVLVMVEGKMPDYHPQYEQNNDLFSSGIRNLILGFGLIFISILLLFNLPGSPLYWLLTMISGIASLASGITRLVKADQPKANTANQAAGRNSLPKSQSDAPLPPIQTEYIAPENLNYRTDNLAREPFSITEPTTKHLEIDEEGESRYLVEK